MSPELSRFDHAYELVDWAGFLNRVRDARDGEHQPAWLEDGLNNASLALGKPTLDETIMRVIFLAHNANITPAVAKALYKQAERMSYIAGRYPFE